MLTFNNTTVINILPEWFQLSDFEIPMNSPILINIIANPHYSDQTIKYCNNFIIDACRNLLLFLLTVDAVTAEATVERWPMSHGQYAQIKPDKLDHLDKGIGKSNSQADAWPD